MRESYGIPINGTHLTTDKQLIIQKASLSSFVRLDNAFPGRIKYRLEKWRIVNSRTPPRGSRIATWFFLPAIANSAIMRRVWRTTRIALIAQFCFDVNGVTKQQMQVTVITVFILLISKSALTVFFS